MPRPFRQYAHRFHLRRPRHVWLSPQMWRKRVVFSAGAALVGLVAVLFALAADRAQELFRILSDARPWLPFLLAPAGFALSAWLALRVVPGSQGSGIPQAIAARQIDRAEARNRLLSLRIAVGKIALTLLGLACGASIGREGPTVQIGASIMLAAGTFAGIGRQPGLILAGGAAGVAAAFNTPLAGVVFAIEEMSRSFERRTGNLVMTAVIIGGLAAMMLSGNYTYFGRTDAAVDWTDAAAVVSTGLIGGIAGALFSRIVLGINRSLARGRLARAARRPVLFALACGLLVALAGALSGGLTFGTGYAQAQQALAGEAALPWSYAPLKLLATAVCAVSGIPGGVFSPSLSVGAGIGSVLAGALPGSPVGAVILLAMTGYFAGAVQAPLTAVIIVMEMSRDPAMLLPLMLTALLASNIARLVSPHSLYHALAEAFLHSRREAPAETRSVS